MRQASWMGRSFYHQLPMQPLRKGEIETLVYDLLGGDATLSSLSPRIVDRAEGNPFFTEEVVRALVESGKLEGERGAYRAAET